MSKRAKTKAKPEPMRASWTKIAVDWTQPDVVRREVANLPDDLLNALGRVEAERAILRWLAMEHYGENAKASKQTTSTWSVSMAMATTTRKAKAKK